MFNCGAVLWFLGSTVLFASTVRSCYFATQSINISEIQFITLELKDPCTKLEPNVYVDELISKLKNKTIDTIPLPDDPEFASLKEGQLWGLSTMRRSGNSTVKCNETFTTVETLLTFEELRGRYKWERVHLKTLSGFVSVEADTTDILFRVSQERGNNTGITLEELSIKDLSGIHTNMTGLGVVSWAVSAITQPAANLFKKSFARIVEGPLKEAIGMALSDIDLPL